MSDSKDLSAISEIVTHALRESEARMTSRMEKMLFDSEVMLLNEMDRYDKKNEKRFAKIEREMENLKDIYRITKNEHETISILLWTMEKFEKRLTALEMKTA